MDMEARIRRTEEKQARMDERLMSMENWRKDVESRSTRITITIVGGVITLLVTLLAALVLTGIGV